MPQKEPRVTLPPLLRNFLPASLPPVVEAELESLYSGTDLLPDDGHDLMRLLQPEEAVAETAALRDSWFQLPQEILVLWTDDNSNYAGCYVDGDLAPRVVLIHHEELDYTPKFHSPSTFQDARRAGYATDKAWPELVTDYPARSGGDYPLLAADRDLALAFLAAYEADPSTRASAHYALQLIPYSDTEMILPLLQAEDMWVQEHACHVLGARQYSAAIDHLRQVAIDGKHNGRIAALRALRSMPSPEARRVVAELRSALPPEFDLYLR
jgi:hypothetical protein